MQKLQFKTITEKVFFGKWYPLVIFLRILLTPIKFLIKVVITLYKWTWEP